MKKVFFIIVAVMVVQLVQAQRFIVDDANAALRSIGNFNAIHVTNAIDLYITQGDEDALAVSANDVKYRDRIKVEVKDGVLKIWYDNEGYKWGNDDKKLKAYISFKNINKISASGASDVYVNGKIKVPRLDLSFSGASDFKGEVEVGNIDADINGASDLTIKGSVANLNISASGASDLKGYDLIAEKCSAIASGASSIKITVNKELSVKASGASDVYYKGSGTIINVNSSGSSSVSKKG